MKRDERAKVAFGIALRHMRMKVGFSQEGLAARAGLNRTYVGDVERGQRNIAIVNITKLANAMGVPVSALTREMEKHLG